THIDRDHWHNHLVVNSVSCDTGLKLQFNEKDLEQLRTLSDKICAAHGLEVLKPYQKPDMKPMGAGEYRAAVRGNSYKFQLMNAIDKAMTQSRTKGEFTACMEQMGYGVKWIPHYQNITYTTPKGKRCRDDKLHTRRYLKEMMEREFELRRTQTEEQQLAARERIAGAGSTATKLLSTADRKLGRDTAAAPQPQGAERRTTHQTEPTAEQGRFTGDTASGQGNGADIITGWEAEREILFHPEMALAEGAAQPNVAIAV
ncbi:MAG: relaxase/mobilization nuclease domain-containing protein, partial [Oscillospiraceae bacterium]